LKAKSLPKALGFGTIEVLPTTPKCSPNNSHKDPLLLHKCHLLTLSTSKYLEIPPLMNFSFSTNLDASSPHIGWNGTSFGTPTGNLSCLEAYSCHSRIGGPSYGLHNDFVEETLYHIISHPI
jgi:hypothetical protein